jgi:hypothetical protein
MGLLTIASLITAFFVVDFVTKLFLISFSPLFIGLGGSCLMILLKGDKYDNEQK